MSRRIVIRPRADADIDEQVEYIARGSLTAARRFHRAVERAFQSLAAMPAMGSSWEATRPEFAGLRFWPIH